QGRRLPRHSRQRDQDAGDDAGQGGGQDDGGHRPSARGPQGQRALAQRRGHQGQQLLRRAHDDGDHHHAQSHSTGQGGEAPEGQVEGGQALPPDEGKDEGERDEGDHDGERTQEGHGGGGELADTITAGEGVRRQGAPS